MCVGCMATNYARLNSCHRCSRSKPNEWVCVLCNSMNSGAELTIYMGVSTSLKLVGQQGTFLVV